MVYLVEAEVFVEATFHARHAGCHGKTSSVVPRMDMSVPTTWQQDAGFVNHAFLKVVHVIILLCCLIIQYRNMRAITVNNNAKAVKCLIMLIKVITNREI